MVAVAVLPILVAAGRVALYRQRDDPEATARKDAYLASLRNERASSGERPNVVVLLFDDLGYGDLGAYGSRAVRTPSIDRLAAEGALFRHGYAVSPYCSASRAGLLTGRYPVRMGLDHVVQAPGTITDTLERFEAIHRPVHLKPRIGKGLSDGVAERHFVVHHQHRRTRRRRRRSKRPVRGFRQGLGQTRFADRQLDVERRAAASRRFCRQPATVLLDDRVGDGQSESGALSNLFGRKEWIENSGQQVLGHTRPIVIHFEDHGFLIRLVAMAAVVVLALVLAYLSSRRSARI